MSTSAVSSGAVQKTCGGSPDCPTPQKKCAKCLEQMYCSRECQVKHWPQHKLVCRLSPFYASANRRQALRELLDKYPKITVEDFAQYEQLLSLDTDVGTEDIVPLMQIKAPLSIVKRYVELIEEKADLSNFLGQAIKFNPSEEVLAFLLGKGARLPREISEALTLSDRTSQGVIANLANYDINELIQELLEQGDNEISIEQQNEIINQQVAQLKDHLAKYQPESYTPEALRLIFEAVDQPSEEKCYLSASKDEEFLPVEGSQYLQNFMKDFTKEDPPLALWKTINQLRPILIKRGEKVYAAPIKRPLSLRNSKGLDYIDTLPSNSSSALTHRQTTLSYLCINYPTITSEAFTKYEHLLSKTTNVCPDDFQKIMLVKAPLSIVKKYVETMEHIISKYVETRERMIKCDKKETAPEKPACMLSIEQIQLHVLSSFLTEAVFFNPSAEVLTFLMGKGARLPRKMIDALTSSDRTSQEVASALKNYQIQLEVDEMIKSVRLGFGSFGLVTTPEKQDEEIAEETAVINQLKGAMFDEFQPKSYTPEALSLIFEAASRPPAEER